MNNSGETISRRRYLISTATVISAVGLAGCTGSDDQDDADSVMYSYMEHLEDGKIEEADALVHPDADDHQHPALHEYDSHSILEPLTTVTVDKDDRVVMEIGGTMMRGLTPYDVDYTVELRSVEEGVWRVWSVEADDPEKHDWIGTHD